MLCIIADGDNTELARTMFDGACETEDRQEQAPLVNTIQTFTKTTTVKLRGYVALGSGTNFASGFRIDSGTKGTYSTITAIRLGPAAPTGM